jgi:hypothetical protein
MADTKKEPTGQEPSTQADQKAAAASQDTDTKRLAGFLTSILTQVQSQVEGTPSFPPLVGKALEAVDLFGKILAALALQLCQTTITLTADPDSAEIGDLVTLTWTATDAQTVTIHSDQATPRDIGPVRADAGKIRVTITGPKDETFFATATGPCCTRDSNKVKVKISSQ